MKHWGKIKSILIIALFIPFGYAPLSLAAPCVAPDNGSGTVNLPANCPYIAPLEPMYIIDGLPPGTTIELDPVLEDFLNIVRITGGSLGGEILQFDATLDLTVSGTGDLTGFNRHLAVHVSCEVHTGVRNPGDPVQQFPAVMFRMQGQLFGDPDFCEFIVRAGTDYGLPAPGQITLTELPEGDYAVDSFFDITYQIEFEGCPGSPLEDYVGTTTATVLLKQGEGDPPATGACCSPGDTCAVATEVYCQNISGLYYGDDSHCLGDSNSDGKDDLCLPPGCCLDVDNGSGTVDLPAECPYTAPYEPMYIIDGLPPGTTIELIPLFGDFFCDMGTPCSGLLPLPDCEGTGGTLGGNFQCFEATLDLTVSGIGVLTGFSRHLAVSVSSEIHTAPRTPGNPLQTFSTVMFRLQGQLFGDPDFCEFIVTGGTDYGLPSPGETTLIELPGGDFAVDSFFDITYQIQFQGCPGSVLDGYAGVTTATIRWQQGVEADDDGDCIANNQDNCRQVYNPTQLDSNANCPGPPYVSDPLCGDACESIPDADGDGVPDGSDNCPDHPNGPNLGTCIHGTLGEICTDSGECGTSGFCSMNQEDDYPPGGNGVGEACECEGNFDYDQDVDGSDAARFKSDFGRSFFSDPCPVP